MRGTKRLGSIAIVLFAVALPAGAQVVRDGSLGTGTITDGLDSDGRFADYVITEEHGALADSNNLFFSFSDFSLSDFSAITMNPEIASFTLTAGYAGGPIANIIAGVSGGTSTIDGIIRTSNDLEGAALFLINPAGIVFGDDAQLDVKGSFHASTADVLRFETGPDFDARQTSTPRLLSSAQPSAFGFTGPGASGLSVNRSDLSVDPGYTLSLIGADNPSFPLLAGVEISGEVGNPFIPVLSAPGATIQIAAARPGTDIPVVLSDLSTDDLAQGELGSVLVNAALVDVRTDLAEAVKSPAGAVVIRAETFVMANLAQIRANNRVSSAAVGPIDIATTGNIELRTNSLIETASEGDGAGASGDILLHAGQLVSVTGGSDLNSFTTSSQQAGAIDIAADSIVIEDAMILSRTRSSGSGGAIYLDAQSIELADGARVNSDTTKNGVAGDITVSAQRLTISNEANDPIGTFIATNTFSTVEGAGSGGDLAVEVETLELLEGGQLIARTEGAGNAGALTVTASSLVHLSGVSESGAPSGITSSALKDATGTGGKISITSPIVEVQNGAQIASGTMGAGAAGSIEIIASDRVSVDGGENGPSVISAATLAQAGSPMQLGPGGAIRIEADRFELIDGGQVTASTSGTGDAGSINIRANSVAISGASDLTGFNDSGVFSQSLTDGVVDGGDGGDIDITAIEDVAISNGGRISTNTDGSGQGGSIELIAGRSVRLESDASISAQASGTGDSAGDAGDIDIASSGAIEMYHSAVTTEAANSSGGNIEIAASDLLYLENSQIETEVIAGNQNEAAGDVTAASEVVALNHSHIIANAAGLDVDAGNISITADQFLLSGDSFLQASAELGIDGTINVSSPDTDLTGTLATLPENFLDASAMLARDCAARTARAGSFAVRTQGEILPPPDAAIGLDDIGLGVTHTGGTEGCQAVEDPS